jgi:hypothetical protein
MEQIATVLSRPSASSNELDALALTNKRASRLWQRMAELYGNKWHSQMGPAPTELWLRAVSGLSDDQLKVGINACLYSDDQWPPSLPEFVSRCKARRENAGMYANTPLLPAAKSSAETAAEQLSAMRAKLRSTASPVRGPTLSQAVDDYAWFSAREGWDAEAPLRA